MQGSQPVRAKKIMWQGIRTKQFLWGQVSQRESIHFYIHNLDHIDIYITFFITEIWYIYNFVTYVLCKRYVHKFGMYITNVLCL